MLATVRTAERQDGPSLRVFSRTQTHCHLHCRLQPPERRMNFCGFKLPFCGILLLVDQKISFGFFTSLYRKTQMIFLAN